MLISISGVRDHDTPYNSFLLLSPKCYDVLGKMVKQLPPKPRKLNLPCYLTHDGEKKISIPAFPKSISTKVNATDYTGV